MKQYCRYCNNLTTGNGIYCSKRNLCLSETYAKAEAEANELIRKSLSDAVLKQQYLEKWDGKLPSVQSGDSMILDIGSVEKE